VDMAGLAMDTDDGIVPATIGPLLFSITRI